MSILGIRDVIRRVHAESLIIDLGARDLSNPEGTGIDLRLGAVHKITKGGAYIEVDEEAGLGTPLWRYYRRTI